MNTEERPPSRTAGIILRLLAKADAIGITEFFFQVGNSAQGKGTQVVVTTRTGSLSWSTPSTAGEEAENGEGRICPDAGVRDLRAGRATDQVNRLQR